MTLEKITLCSFCSFLLPFSSVVGVAARPLLKREAGPILEKGEAKTGNEITITPDKVNDGSGVSFMRTQEETEKVEKRREGMGERTRGKIELIKGKDGVSEKMVCRIPLAHEMCDHDDTFIGTVPMGDHLRCASWKEASGDSTYMNSTFAEVSWVCDRSTYVLGYMKSTSEAAGYDSETASELTVPVPVEWDNKRIEDFHEMIVCPSPPETDLFCAPSHYNEDMVSQEVSDKTVYQNNPNRNAEARTCKNCENAKCPEGTLKIASHGVVVKVDAKSCTVESCTHDMLGHNFVDEDGKALSSEDLARKFGQVADHTKDGSR